MFDLAEGCRGSGGDGGNDRRGHGRVSEVVWRGWFYRALAPRGSYPGRQIFPPRRDWEKLSGWFGGVVSPAHPRIVSRPDGGFLGGSIGDKRGGCPRPLGGDFPRPFVLFHQPACRRGPLAAL